MENLDLTEIRVRAAQYQRKYRRLRNRSLLVLVAAAVVLLWAWGQVRTPVSQMFYYTDSGWREYRLAPGNVINNIAVTRDGAWWILLNDSLLRLQSNDNDNHIYNDTASGNFCQAGLKAYQSMVWCAGGNTVELYQDDMRIGRWDIPETNTSLVVGATGAYTLTETDSVYYFRAGQDDPTSYSLPDDFSGTPSLALDNQASLYLAGDGLWKLSNDNNARTWVSQTLPENFPLTGLRLFGSAQGYLWFATSDGLAMDFVNAPEFSEIYTFADMRIPAGTRLNDVVQDEYGNTWLATDTGLLSYESEWQPMTPLIPSSLPVVRMDGTSGTLVLMRNSSPSFLSAQPWASIVVPIGGMLLVLVLAFFTWIFPYNRLRFERRDRAHKHLMSLLPELQEFAGIDNARQATKNNRRLFPLMILVLILATFIMMNGNISLPVVELAMFGVLMLLQYLPLLGKLASPDTDDETRRYIRRILPRSIISFGVFCLTLIGTQMLLTAPLQSALGDILAVIVVSMVAGLAASAVTSRILLFLPLAPVLRGSLARGDYDTALSQADKLLHVAPNDVLFLLLQATVLDYAGRPADVEAIYRRLVTESQYNYAPNIATLLTGLALTLQAQQKWDEAERLFRGALDIAPDINAAYAGLAGYYLEHEKSPEIALQLLNAMPEPVHRPWLNYALQRHAYASGIGLRALVLAQNGQHASAETLLNKSLSTADKGFKPGYAMLQARAGAVWQAMNDTARAREFYGKAIEIDPNGAAGQKARAALELL